MAISTLVSALILGLTLLGGSGPAQRPDTGPASDFAWAQSCKSCHEAIYDAWARTKHASALDRLSTSDDAKGCVGCHVTGPRERLFDGGKTVNRGVQCEACHGAAAAHAADPAVRTGLVKVPPAETCEACHSDKGPHFKGFFYAAMTGLVHRTK